jgi:hypothetical protein
MAAASSRARALNGNKINTNVGSIASQIFLDDLSLHYICPSRAVECATKSTQTRLWFCSEMVPMIKNFDDIQKVSTASTDATVKSFDAVIKSTQAIATEIADYMKRSFESGTKTMENLVGAKTLDKAIEVQTQSAKAAYEGYVAHATKLGELYADLAKEAFKPYEGVVTKVTPGK